ncbi:hypothetical protein IWW50_000852 [Coemansia erecta]|nr:hypothetical protein GGF43_001274 [Coemansia sp. RSA 2618]KAJ2829439.1 hypothetical protein IWW50_000852 [Coemansia erecta]
MTGLGSDVLPTVKYIKKGVNTCNRDKIVKSVYKSIGSPKPDRLIVVSNTRKPKCPGTSDGDEGGNVVMSYNVDALTPSILFHELGHTLGLNHPATSSCYSISKGMSSNNCKTINHEAFQNMGEIPRAQSWFKSDKLTAAKPGEKGILEYSAYNRLSTLWPMLRESNVLDFTNSGTYQLYNSETASIGNKTAVVRIPLSSLIKNSKSLVDGKVNYHTHYYVEFMQRRTNSAAGGLQNYVVIRSAPDHRAKPGVDTLLMTALSTDDKTFTTSFNDNVRKIKITLKKIDDNGATIDISVPSSYAPYSKINNCYFSSVIDEKTVVASNGNKVCRAIGYNGAFSVGSFNGVACLTAFYNNDLHSVSPPNVEYLHCTDTPKWVKISSAMGNGYGAWGKDDNHPCKATVDGVEYLGRGDATNCFYNSNGEYHWVTLKDNASTYLNWLSL